jgi:hypothetical protein
MSRAYTNGSATAADARRPAPVYIGSLDEVTPRDPGS